METRGSYIAGVAAVFWAILGAALTVLLGLIALDERRGRGYLGSVMRLSAKTTEKAA